DEFKLNLHPAQWAEGFSQTIASTSSYRSNADKGILFDFPRRTTNELPVLSLGQLQHVNLATDDNHPNATVGYLANYPIGNSYHHPRVTRGAAVQSRKDEYHRAGSGTTRYIDFAYLLI